MHYSLILMVQVFANTSIGIPRARRHCRYKCRIKRYVRRRLLGRKMYAGERDWHPTTRCIMTYQFLARLTSVPTLPFADFAILTVNVALNLNS